ncbi:MAG TPA: DNA-binding protein [Verrucomicrobia subdivision 3 bacterium]|nr:DNA-binding protein [Limisphaerales bacterium]
MKPRIYLETTIPSYLVARRSRDLRLAADQETTQEWWEARRQNYELFISEFVRAEVQRGDAQAAAARLALVEGIPMLSEPQSATELAGQILAARLLPPAAALDASHIALATVHAMDYLLTWNCKHIHNVAIIRQIERLCERQGYTCPIICTPNDLMDT